MLRVSWKTSLIAAHTASVSTRTISSTQLAAEPERLLPHPRAPPCRRRRARRRSASPAGRPPASGPSRPSRPSARRSRGSRDAAPSRTRRSRRSARRRRRRRRSRRSAPGCWRRISIADRALAGDHVGVVEGVHEHEAALGRDLVRARLRVGVGVAVQHHLDRAPPSARTASTFTSRRGDRHHDHRAAAEVRGRQGHALGVVAGRRRDDAARELAGAEARPCGCRRRAA